MGKQNIPPSQNIQTLFFLSFFLKPQTLAECKKKCTEGSNKQSPVGGVVLKGVTLKALKTHDCFLCIYRKEGQINGNA